MELKKFQAIFLENILGKTTAENLAMHIIPDGALDEKKVMEVYRSDYSARLTAVLAERYESIWSILGDELFFKLCKDYLMLNPSQSYNLSVYGKEFSSFLRPLEISKEFPFLADLAQLEWMVDVVFHLPSVPSTKDLLAQIFKNPEEAIFQFSPSVQLLPLEYDVHDFWVARGVNQKDKLNKNWQCKAWYLLFKTVENNSKVWVEKLTKAQAHLFVGLCHGKKLGLMLEESELTEQEVGDFLKNPPVEYYH